MPIQDSEDFEDTDSLEELASKAFNDPYNKTLANGFPSTVLRGNKIVKVYHNGHVEEICDAAPRILINKRNLYAIKKHTG